MPERHRPINDNDLLEQLQDNAAMMKTIMKYLEDTSPNPTATQQQNLTNYRQFLTDIKSVYSINTKLI